MIYFDNAATSFPKPINVLKQMNNALSFYGGNPGRSGHKMSLRAAKIVYNLREKASEFFNLNASERVILTKNCTEALNLAIFSVMKNGGNAIISCYEHNSVVRPLEYLKKNNICDYKIAKASFSNSDNVISSFEKLIDNKTKMIICTHASNVTGEIAPINELSQLCKRKKIIFCVDASQTAGIIPIKMNEQNIDILCCPGHKGLYGPTGTGLFLSNEKISLSPIIFGGTGSVSTNLNQPDFMPDLLESGTVNVVGAAGLYGGISFIEKTGIEKIYNHELSLAQYFYDNLSKMPNITLYTPFPMHNRSVATLSFNVKGKTSTATSGFLDTQNIAVRSGLHCSPLTHNFLNTAPTGTVRVSFSYFNNLDQVYYLCKILKNL